MRASTPKPSADAPVAPSALACSPMAVRARMVAIAEAALDVPALPAPRATGTSGR